MTCSEPPGTDTPADTQTVHALERYDKFVEQESDMVSSTQQISFVIESDAGVKPRAISKEQE